jgi:hypothetical protein
MDFVGKLVRVVVGSAVVSELKKISANESIAVLNRYLNSNPELGLEKWEFFLDLM